MERRDRFTTEALAELPSPCYVIDERAMEDNCRTLDEVQRRTGCRVLMALKGFAVSDLFPMIGGYLSGICASGLYEARLGRERFGKEVHVFAPAYDDLEFEQLLEIVDHVVFNSVAQWERRRPAVEAGPRKVSCGIRINPEHSDIPTSLWDPCARYSRFGVKAADLRSLPEGIEGLHFHALCQQDSDALERLLAKVEEGFGHLLSEVEWVNFGGGQLVTAPWYDVDRLCGIVTDFKERHGVDVYLEPGEAVAYDAGILLSTVLDIVRNEMEIAILDISAWNHLQDILTSPWRPEVIGGRAYGESDYSYRLASRSCLSGDIIGDYSFERALQRGTRVMFADLASYSVVSNNVFNGIPLPAVAVLRRSGEVDLLHRAGYEDYVSRL